MRKILSVAILTLVCSFTFAQTSPETTSLVKESNFITNKVKGEFNFQMPVGTSVEKINKTAKYYTEYFTVTYDSKTRNAKIQMIQENMRGVVLRFLVSNDIKTISYNDEEYEVEKFVGNFIQ